MPNNSVKVILLVVFYSVFYFFPWAEINVTGGFRDFEGYVAKFANVTYHDIELNYHPSKERLWEFLVVLNSNILSDVRLALSMMSIAIILLWLRFSYKYLSKHYASLMLMVSPPVIDVAFSGIRNGLAWALLFYVFFVLRGKARYILCIFPLYIHVTSLLPILFYTISNLVRKSMKSSRPLILVYLFFPGLLTGSVLMFGFTGIMGLIGDGRTAVDLRGIGFNKVSFWIILFFLFHKSYYKIWQIENLRPIAIVAFNLISFTIVVSFFLSWSDRLIGITSILLVPLVANFNKLDRLLFLCLFFIWNLILFLYWTPAMSILKQ